MTQSSIKREKTDEITRLGNENLEFSLEIRYLHTKKSGIITKIPKIKSIFIYKIQTFGEFSTKFCTFFIKEHRSYSSNSTK